MNMQRRVWEQNARNEGLAEGRAEKEKVIHLMARLASDGRISDIQRASEDPTYLKILLGEYEKQHV